MRKCHPYAFVTQCPAQRQPWSIPIDIKHRRWSRRCKLKFESTVFLCILQHGVHIHLSITPKKINLVIHKFEQNYPGIRNNIKHKLVSIWQLIASRINFEIIGIALIHNALAPNPLNRIPCR